MSRHPGHAHPSCTGSGRARSRSARGGKLCTGNGGDGSRGGAWRPRRSYSRGCGRGLEPPYGRLRGDPAAPPGDQAVAAPHRVPALARRHPRADAGAGAVEPAPGARLLPELRGAEGSVGLRVRHRRHRRGRARQRAVEEPDGPPGGPPPPPEEMVEGRRRVRHDDARHLQQAAVPVRQHQARRRHLPAQPGNRRGADAPAAAGLRAVGVVGDADVELARCLHLRVRADDGAVQGRAPPVLPRSERRVQRGAGVRAGEGGGGAAVVVRCADPRRELLSRRRRRQRRRRGVLANQGRRARRVVRRQGGAGHVHQGAAGAAQAALQLAPGGGARAAGPRLLQRPLGDAGEGRRLGPRSAGVEPPARGAAERRAAAPDSASALRARRLRRHRKRGAGVRAQAGEHGDVWKKYT
jgi:hypothetical protein